MGRPLDAIYKAIKKLATQPRDTEQAMERAVTLSQSVPLERFSPSAIARSTTFTPAAQRGFSESMVSSKAPVATTLIRPGEWAARTPPLEELRDARIVEQLKRSLEKDKLRDLPLLWIDEYPSGLEAGYEGRHRMRALQELYGNDPVPVNIVPGARFNMKQTKFYPFPTREYVEEVSTSPLQLLRNQVQFGDRPMRIKPLWIKE